ncbi:hypothetical protein ACROYT_G013843 [Oculina patagonica]
MTRLYIKEDTSKMMKRAHLKSDEPSLLTCHAQDFLSWLTGSGGGCKSNRQAQQIVSRCLKFLKLCCEEDEDLTFEIVDFSLYSPNLLFKFVDMMRDEWNLWHAGRIGYLDAIAEMGDFSSQSRKQTICAILRLGQRATSLNSDFNKSVKGKMTQLTDYFKKKEQKRSSNERDRLLQEDDSCGLEEVLRNDSPAAKRPTEES